MIERHEEPLPFHLRGNYAPVTEEVTAFDLAVEGALPLDAPLGHEWASDPERVATVTIALVDDLEEAVRLANEETSGLSAGIVAEDAEAGASRVVDMGSRRVRRAIQKAAAERSERLRRALAGNRARPIVLTAKPGFLDGLARYFEAGGRP